MEWKTATKLKQTKSRFSHTQMHARTHTHTHRDKVSAKARKSYKDAANVDAASLPLREIGRERAREEELQLPICYVKRQRESAKRERTGESGLDWESGRSWQAKHNKHTLTHAHKHNTWQRERERSAAQSASQSKQVCAFALLLFLLCLWICCCFGFAFAVVFLLSLFLLVCFICVIVFVVILLTGRSNKQQR